MSKIKIEFIKHEQKISLGGKPWTSCSIMTLDKDKNKTYISGFGNDVTRTWGKGDIVDLEITAKQVGDKVYYNFAEPKNRNFGAEIDALTERISQLESFIANQFKTPQTQVSSPSVAVNGTVEELAKAFGGEIVGQDPDEAPTDAQLESMFGK